MRISFTGSVPKTEDFPDTNEDCFLIDGDQNRVVLCDGASESFDSKTWARNLAQMFMDDPAITPEWVDKVIASYSATYDVQALSWSKQAAFERGSFSTLLGVEVNKETGWIEIFSVGDSIAILVDDEQIAASWPYTTPEQFDERPSLLSTIPHLNEFVGQAGFYLQRQVSWTLEHRRQPVLLCMTDALGQWTLRMVRENNDAWKRLLYLQSVAELSSLVQEERAAKRMRTDDSTLVVIQFGETGVEA